MNEASKGSMYSDDGRAHLVVYSSQKEEAIRPVRVSFVHNIAVLQCLLVIPTFVMLMCHGQQFVLFCTIALLSFQSV